jgi:hypothetical protein
LVFVTTSSSCQINSPLTPPPTPVSTYNFNTPLARLAHDVAAGSALHLAHHATREWMETTPHTKFGQTYHIMVTPQQWALQSLSLNISHALGKYLQGAALTNLSHCKSCIPPISQLNLYSPTPYSFCPRAPVLLAAAPHAPHTFYAEPTLVSRLHVIT